MPGRKSKREPSSVPVPPSPSPSVQEEDYAATSPKRGRKENEQKRRVVMNQYFDELIALLTLLSQRHIPKRMDKVATLRETITCLKVYHHLTSFEPSTDAKLSPVIGRGDALSLLLNSQDAFLVMISDSGRIMFSTSLVTSLLGYIQTRLIGQNWYNYVHDKDKEMFHSLFRDPDSKRGSHIPNTLITTFPSQACTLHLRLYPGETGAFPQFLPFKCLAYLRKWGLGDIVDQDPPSPDGSLSELSPLPDNQYFVLLIGKLPTSLTSVDLPIGTNDVNFEFEMRVSKEGRIISIERHAILLIGYSTPEIIGTSFFDYVDPYHLSDIAESISTFAKTGLGTTTPYRLMTKSGRYIWLISKTYTSYNPWVNKPDHILLSNRILGCDQVLPEHRFYRSRKLLPDLENDEEYTLSPSMLNQPPCLECPPLPNLQQNPLVEEHASSHGFDPSSVMSQFPEVSSFINQPLLPGTVQSTVQANKTQSQPQTTDPSWMNVSSRPTDFMPSPVSITGTAAQGVPQMPHGLLEIQRELERKNQEIFEMQQRLLEQQKLFEAERTQFYQVSQQVLNCITTTPTQGNVKLDALGSKTSIPDSLSKSQTDVSMIGSPVDCQKSEPSTPSQQSVQTLHRGYDPNHTTAQYFSQSNPSTPQTAFSPYSPASINSPFPANRSPLSTPQHIPRPSTRDSHLDMMMLSQPPQQFPPYLPQTSYVSSPSTTMPSYAQEEPTSLAMHNDLVCDTLGLSTAHQLGQAGQTVPSPAVSHIQTLSDMFGGH